MGNGRTTLNGALYATVRAASFPFNQSRTIYSLETLMVLSGIREGNVRGEERECGVSKRVLAKILGKLNMSLLVIKYLQCLFKTY